MASSRKVQKEPFNIRLSRSRANATVRERQRLAQINNLLNNLSHTVPQEFQGLATKVEVIRGVTDYIRTLTGLLQELRSRDSAMANTTNNGGTTMRRVIKKGKIMNMFRANPISVTIDRQDKCLIPRGKPVFSTNSRPNCAESYFHLDPESHSSLIPPGVVKMNESPPSVIINWNPPSNLTSYPTSYIQSTNPTTYPIS
ncbi:uncharacterized protein [Apostichopus japonicus]|uniref:uncharacterized protein isoform X1 n=1 Tax=Stichopus japonicus TaxID=307972 RepID=UPI003AB3DAA1